MLRKLVVLFITGMLLSNIVVEAKDLSVGKKTSPTFELDFSKGFDAIGRNGIIKAKIEGQPQLVDGKFGKAMKSGPDTGYLYFPPKDIVNPERGTVEMWVCPLDWDGREEKFHSFFDVQGVGALYLYKYYQGGLLMLSCKKVEGPYAQAAAPITSWKPKEWHHIAGTWSRWLQCIYVDGKLIRTTKVTQLPSSLSEPFRIGDHPWHIPRTSSSLIEGVRIYDQFLSEKQIAAHYAGNYDATFPLSEKSFSLGVTIDPNTHDLTAQVELLEANTEESTVSASFSLAQSQQPVKIGEPVSFAKMHAEKVFHLNELKSGSYTLTALVTENGQERAKFTKSFDIPSTSWMGNTIGLEDIVLPPWTPITVSVDKGIVVSCWGRTYIFNEHDILPSQIVSAGKEMLARPITLTVCVDKKELQWMGGTMEVKSSSPTKVELRGTTHAVLAGRTIVLKSTIIVEYDGLVIIDCSLEMPDGMKPDSIVQEIPMQQNVVYYRHRYDHKARVYSRTGDLPLGSGVVDSSPFIPFAWLGDNNRGLFWFCETSEFWPNCKATNAFETARTAKGKIVSLRFNLLAAGQTLPKQWHYQFGLQATPVKPIPKDWRKWRLTPAINASVDCVWPFALKNSMKYYGYPEAMDPQTFAKSVDDLHKQKIKVMPYSCLGGLSEGSGELMWYGSKWTNGTSDVNNADVMSYGSAFQGVCPQAKYYSDFIIAKNKEFMDRYQLDGYYHDWCQVYPCSKLDTGCGYKHGEKTIVTYPFLATRALYRRLYALVKSCPRPTFNMGHMSGRLEIPILAYEDAYLDGEHFLGDLKDSYLDVTSLDIFRAEFMGRQWGVMPFFLPAFKAPYKHQIEPTRGLAALLMIHDIAPWANKNSCNLEVFNKAFKSLDAFGYVNADFIAYFDPDPPATTRMKDVYASAYLLPGKALIIVANLSKEDRAGTLTLNQNSLGVSLTNVLSWPDKTPIDVNGNSITLNIPRLGYRMLYVGDINTLRLQVIKAKWGSEDKWLNVTDKLKEKISNETLNFSFEKAYRWLGDPSPGRKKSLVIEYEYNGQKQTKEYIESSVNEISLP